MKKKKKKTDDEELEESTDDEELEESTDDERHGDSDSRDRDRDRMKRIEDKVGYLTRKQDPKQIRALVEMEENQADQAKEIKALRRENAVGKAQRRYKLDDDDAEFLTGDSEKEILESAKKLRARFDKSTAKSDDQDDDPDDDPDNDSDDDETNDKKSEKKRVEKKDLKSDEELKEDGSKTQSQSDKAVLRRFDAAKDKLGFDK